MEIRRTMAAGALGLALVAGAAGCGKIAEKAAEEAVERGSDCKDVDIDEDGGFAGSCNGQDLDLDVDGGASLPDDWPAELAPPAGAKIVAATSDATTLTVTAGLDGDVATVTDGIAAQLETAGYTIDSRDTADAGGTTTSSISATGPAYEAAVGVTDTPNAVDGDVTVSYILTRVAG